MQETQEESIASFDRYMTQCIDEEWALSKRHLFESTLADRGRSDALALALPTTEPGDTLAAVTRPGKASPDHASPLRFPIRFCSNV